MADQDKGVTLTEEELAVANQQERIAALQAENVNLLNRVITLRALVNRLTAETENAEGDKDERPADD